MANSRFFTYSITNFVIEYLSGEAQRTEWIPAFLPAGRHGAGITAQKGGCMISKILVATDGSETARKAVKYAAGLARETGAGIILLSVIDKSHLLSRSVPAVATPTHLMEPVEDYLKQAADAYIGEAARLFEKKGMRPKKIVRLGHPVREIIREAERNGADLIIVGSHGRSAATAAVLGSVAYGVIHRDTRIPVLVVKG
jgi:nucleotide-binding universal stress UspA family protein